MKYSNYVRYASIAVLALLALLQVSADSSDGDSIDSSNTDSMMMAGNSTMNFQPPQGNDNAIMDRFVSMCWWCNPMNQYLCCAGKSRWEQCCGPETTTAKTTSASKPASKSSAPASSAPASSAPTSR